tara:strand:+ start:716 stop:1318 length:603 start_codon:yes stop_codon:yes gene_type:complete
MSDFKEIEMLENLLKAINEEGGYNLDEFTKQYSQLDKYILPETDVTKNEFSIGYSIKFINKSNNPDPEYSTEGSAGFDFRANINEVVTLGPGEKTMISTGLYFELPTHLELQVRPRSGLAAKHGVTVLNSPGTIDSDYRGEVMIILINHGKEPFIIENGDRIAQGVLSSLVGKTLVNFTKVESLNQTNRGDGGFGSTGIK